jgi:peptidoglycan/LPS O-acetylase OafA/YrhL
MTPVKDRLAYLDVARGIAALLVVLEHGLGLCLPGYLDWSLWRMNLGQIGVMLFFVISGFIIPASLRAGGSQARFWLRRFFRLFPLYWTSIALTWLLTWLTGRTACGVTLEQHGVWLVNLTMLQGFLGQPHVLGVFWTLHMELMIYLACSVLFALRLLERPDRLLWLALAIYVVDGAVLRPLVQGKPFYLRGRMFFILAPLVGAALETWTSGKISGKALAWLIGSLLAGMVTIFTMNAAFCSGPDGKLDPWQLLAPWLVAYVGFGLLVLGRKRFSPAALAWAGRISYSVYLLHPLVLMLLMPARLPGWLFLPCLLGGSLVVSDWTFRLVEDPGMRLGRYLEKWWMPRRSPAVPVPQLAPRLAA